MIKKLITAVLFSFPFLTLTAQQKAQLRTIIIDAGHGGRDNGARGTYSFEKDICLDVALKLGKNLEEAFPEMKILYTRKTDIYPELKERADFANANKGDLFISIHVNAAPPIRNSKFLGHKANLL